MSLTHANYAFLKEIGITELNAGVYRRGQWVMGRGEEFTVKNPSDGKGIAKVKFANEEDYDDCIVAMQEEKARWQTTPAPVRGEIVRQIAEKIRKYKDQLGALLSLEVGKIRSEGLGEVQEVIDICDMAVGMSRTIDGKVLNSERPSHFLMEMWNPLGICGVITAFNFPCAVFGWNSAIALICGNAVMWKGAETASLTSCAVGKIFADVLNEHGFKSIVTVCSGFGPVIGEKMINDKRVDLVSFTGSTAIGKHVSVAVHARFGKCLLELGGNNAAIICEDADLELALKGCTFAAAGTCGQRCTTLRRIYVHEKHHDAFLNAMAKAYTSIKMGDPLEDGTLCGPLHTEAAVKMYKDGIEEIKKQGGKIIVGGNAVDRPGNYVEPTIVSISPDAPIIQKEIFVPIVYVMKFNDFESAIQANNSVPQGLSSSIFTKNLQNYFKWVGPLGSDCGIVNCNIGPSGAEIGGAFGGEKETGGGRESGSDAWKQYMRRSTCTVNYGNDLPLAQGVKFDVGAKL